MEALILDSRFTTIGIVDAFISFIWTERYQSYGDFELYLPVSEGALDLLQTDRYVQMAETDRIMIIEQIEIKTDPEHGNYLTVTGRSLESLLERRVVGQYTVLSGGLQAVVQKLLDQNALCAGARQLPGLSFRPSDDPGVIDAYVELSLQGETLYEAIQALCREKNIGFRILLDGPGTYYFELYKGADRTYDQTDRPPVVFSPDFENLLATNYLETKTGLRTSAYAIGSGEGAEYEVVESGGGTGLERRETFVRANVTMPRRPDAPNTAGMTQSQAADALADYQQKLSVFHTELAVYRSELFLKGREEIAKTKVVQAFEGEIDASRQFVYGTDFELGDLVQVKNEYGMTGRSRVAEVVRSHDVNGEAMYPTFTTMEEI